MKSLLRSITLGLAALALTACGVLPSSWSVLPLWPHRLELGSGVVVAFVEGLTPEMSEKVAYVTHVPTGSQAILDREGKVVGRHDGRADGPSRLEAVLEDDAAMARITAVLTNRKGARPRDHTILWVPLILDREGKVVGRHDGRADGPSRLEAVLEDDAAMARITAVLTNRKGARPRDHTILWVPLMQFGGIQYVRAWHFAGEEIREGERDLRAEDLGPEFYRVAFRGAGYAGPNYRIQDGDATLLNPGTQVYAVKGYAPEFRLGTLEEGKAILYEADTNSFAKTGGDLLDIRGKVTAIDILNDDHPMTVAGTIDDEQTIEQLVETVLAAPVNQRSRDHDGPRYFLGIRLADGTSVVRAFWLETGELSRGIMAGSEVVSMVSNALPD